VLKMGTRVYVGDLGSVGSKPELEKEFEQYGSLKSVWVARSPPGKRDHHCQPHLHE
jgi:RNA recognition motif-containing protein